MRKLYASIGILAAIGSAIYLVVASKETDFYLKALPPQFEKEGFVTSGSDYGLFSVLSMRTKACGAVVFSLRQTTIDAIKRDGLAFFGRARQGRGYPSQAYYRYAPWRQTPTPREWFGDGAVAGSMACAGLDSVLFRRITAGGRSTSGYYTTKDEGELIVLPDDGIAVLAYDG